MNTSSRTYVRLSVIIFSVVIGLLFLFSGNHAFAKDYIFTWDANHPNDMVVEYRIYNRTNSSIRYDPDVYTSIKDGLATSGIVSLEANQDGYCFAIKAVDENDYQSDFADNEEGDGDACNNNPNDLPFGDDDGNTQVSSSSGGGGGGGCFLNLIR